MKFTRDYTPRFKPERTPPKEPKPLKRVSERKEQEIRESKVEDANYKLWMMLQVKKCKGVCLNCGARFKPTHFNVCHILPKAIFVSVKMHDDVWVELCAWGNGSCHGNMDNSTRGREMETLKCFPLIIEKFIKVFPYVKEKAKIPDVLLQYVEP